MTYAPIRLREFDPRAGDPVLGCLVALARRHRLVIDEGVLRAGLARHGSGRVSLAEIPLAARRAGLEARPLDVEAENLHRLPLPSLLLLVDGDACVLMGRRSDGYCELLLPEATGPALVPTATLAGRYGGHAFGLRLRDRPTDQDSVAASPSPGRAAAWRRHIPFALAALPGDAFLLLFAVLLPSYASGWDHTPIAVAGACAIAILLEGILRLLGHSLEERLGRSFGLDLSSRFFHELLGRARPASAGAFAAAVQAYESSRKSLFRSAVAPLVELPMAVMLLASLLYLSRPLAIALLAALPLFPVLGLILGPVAERVNHAQARDQAKRHGLLVETLAAVETIRALALTGRMEQRWNKHSLAAARSEAAASMVELFGCRLPRVLGAAALVGMACLGVSLVTATRMDAATFAACLLISGRLLAYMADVTVFLANRKTALAILATFQQPHPGPFKRDRAEPHVIFPELRKAVSFDAVSFQYPKLEPVLDNASFEVHAGERVALSGPPGTGKSTVARLLLGLQRPDAGIVSLDGRSVTDKDWDAVHLIGYVPQEPTLFAGTLRENLTICRPEADIDALRRAASLAGVDALIDRLGLDQWLPENGAFLSLGERQGLALARTLLADRSILLLDDPCSAWEDEALTCLAKRLEPVLPGRTLILLSQRQPLLTLAHRTLRLEAGKVIAEP